MAPDPGLFDEPFQAVWGWDPGAIEGAIRKATPVADLASDQFARPGRQAKYVRRHLHRLPYFEIPIRRTAPYSTDLLLRITLLSRGRFTAWTHTTDGHPFHEYSVATLEKDKSGTILLRIGWLGTGISCLLFPGSPPSLVRVPPDVSSVREAIAWTFGMTAAQYKPGKET